MASTRTIGPLAICDTGVPAASAYTTLVLIHGFAWHSGVFSRMLSFCNDRTRLVLLNRRGYPGSAPFGDDERWLLESAHSSDPKAVDTIQAYMKARTREIYDFLDTFVHEERLAPASVIVAGWSFGSVFALALLAHASSFTPREQSRPLTEYIKRVIAYDPPYHCYGYAPPPNYYNPATHEPVDGPKLFPTWVSGYYDHGSSVSELEFRVPLKNPPPSVLAMTAADLDGALYSAPTVPGGSDHLLVHIGIDHGLWETIRRAALYVPVPGKKGSPWDSVELRHIWCDRSIWEMPWGTWALEAEMRAAKAAGTPVRRISIMRIAGANHFLHWDHPERALKALLSELPVEGRARL